MTRRVKHTDDNEIAANLRVVISRLVKILRSEIKNDELLSLTERSTLALVYQSSAILPSELAVMEKVTNQSMSQIINKLVGLGYIKKTSSETDRRKVIITICAAGKKKDMKSRNGWLNQSLKKPRSRKKKYWLKQLWS